MRIQITQEFIFKTVSVNQIPDFFKEITDVIFKWLREQKMVIPETPYQWLTWQENPDTGIYLNAGRLTSVRAYSDWIVEGFIRELSHYDEPGFIYTHQLVIQNAWQKVKIEVKVLLGRDVYEVYFEVELPEALQKPFVDSLLATS
jgi:hypothetical protein